MAWNEPGGNKPRDPWGGGGDQGPPDLDEVLKNLRGKFSGLFGGKGGGSNGGGASVVAIVLVALTVLYLFWGRSRFSSRIAPWCSALVNMTARWARV